MVGVSQLRYSCFPIHNLKSSYNFVCCILWVWIVSSYIKGRTWCWGEYLALGEEETGAWKKLHGHNPELHFVYFLPMNNIRITKSRWRDGQEDWRVNMNIHELDGQVWTEFVYLTCWQLVRSREQGNECRFYQQCGGNSWQALELWTKIHSVN
jgi:hypothetical protein